MDIGPEPAPGFAFYSLETGEALSEEDATCSDAIFGEWHGHLFESEQSVAFVRVSGQKYGVDILCGEGAAADSTGAFCERFGAQAGINGSYFNMRSLTHNTFVKDAGYVVSTTTQAEVFRTNGVVFCSPDTVAIDFYGGLIPVGSETTTGGIEAADEALAAGPILIDDGTTITYEEGIPGWNEFYARRHPRSMIGTDAAGNIWLVVVDGRVRDRAAGMTVAELTALAQKIGLTDALNLDGGGSSTLWTLPAGAINYPTDNRRYDHYGQRRIPSAIGLKKK